MKILIKMLGVVGVLIVLPVWAGPGQGCGKGCGGRGQAEQGNALGQSCAQGCGGGCGQAGQGKGRRWRGGQGATETLTGAEKAGLLHMREEEALALEVYTELGKKWGLRMFDNISAAEQRHIDAVGAAIERYGLEDPLVGRKPGTYQNETLQALYTELISSGTESLEGALRVGALIEEIDIKDLQHHIAATTNGDIKAMYENLMRASRNHLRAFAGQLRRRNVTYESKHLSQAEFDAIARADHERGRGGR